MAGVTARYGETGPSPYLLPLSVDGLIVVASISLVELAGRIRHLETAPTPAATTAPATPTPTTVDTTTPTTDPATPTPPATPRKATPPRKAAPPKKTAAVKKAAPAKTGRPRTSATVDSPPPAVAPAVEPIPAHLLPAVRFATVTHQQNTGQAITADELATRLNIGAEVARRLLLALRTEDTPAAAPAAVNGTTTVVEAVR